MGLVVLLCLFGVFNVWVVALVLVWFREFDCFMTLVWYVRIQWFGLFICFSMAGLLLCWCCL